MLRDEPYDFEDQSYRPLDPPVVVPAGGRVLVDCTYLNETASTLGFGESTNDEMCFRRSLSLSANGSQDDVHPMTPPLNSKSTMNIVTQLALALLASPAALACGGGEEDPATTIVGLQSLLFAQGSIGLVFTLRRRLKFARQAIVRELPTRTAWSFRGHDDEAALPLFRTAADLL